MSTPPGPDGPAADEAGAAVLQLERHIAACGPAPLPGLLAALERLRALALARLVAVTTNARPDRADADPLDELRHLTPLQVAELLNLKEAYIHELCRSSQMPAVKRGKYWMIPVAALREWLSQSRRGIDHQAPASLRFPGLPASSGDRVADPRHETERQAHTPSQRTRRSLAPGKARRPMRNIATTSVTEGPTPHASATS